MCCGFRQISGIIAGMMHMTEKMISCFAVATVITCFVFTTLCMIALGIGIGYNYCIGEMKAGEKYIYKYQQQRRSLPFPASELRTENFTDFSPQPEAPEDKLPLTLENGPQNDTNSLKLYLKELMDSSESTEEPRIAVNNLVPASTDAKETEPDLNKKNNIENFSDEVVD